MSYEVREVTNRRNKRETVSKGVKERGRKMKTEKGGKKIRRRKREPRWR